MSSSTPPQTNPQQPTQGMQPQSTGLPPTGLQQQLTGIKNMQSAAKGMGVNPIQNNNQALQSTLPGGGSQTPRGQTSLQQLAQSLATSYGLQLGRGDMVDSNGNFLMTPDQVAAASGGSETMGTAAAKMNYIAQAMQRQQQEQQAKKSEAAMQTGLGLVQSRGRGSLAAMQSGMYEGLANLYQQNQYEAMDFSYFIQKEQLDIQQDLISRAEKLAKKKAQGQFFGGLAMTGIGLLSGNFAVAGAGAAQAGGSAGSTGWF